MITSFKTHRNEKFLVCGFKRFFSEKICNIEKVLKDYVKRTLNRRENRMFDFALFIISQ